MLICALLQSPSLQHGAEFSTPPFLTVPLCPLPQIPLYPLRQVPRLEFHRNPTVAALLSKGVSSNVVSFYVFASPTANRWQPVTPDVFFFIHSYSRCLVKHSTFTGLFLGDDGLTAHLDGPWWRVLTGRHDGMCVRVAVLTGRLDGPSRRPVMTARVSQALLMIELYELQCSS